MRSLECYFGVYFPRCCATREINTKITRSWAHKQFATRVHTLFSIYTVVLLLGLRRLKIAWSFKAARFEFKLSNRFEIRQAPRQSDVIIITPNPTLSSPHEICQKAVLRLSEQRPRTIDNTCNQSCKYDMLQYAKAFFLLDQCFFFQWYVSTRMWYMISSPATSTVCLEQKSDNFQSRNVTLSMPSSSKN